MRRSWRLARAGDLADALPAAERPSQPHERFHHRGPDLPHRTERESVDQRGQVPDRAHRSGNYRSDAGITAPQRTPGGGVRPRSISEEGHESVAAEDRGDL